MVNFYIYCNIYTHTSYIYIYILFINIKNSGKPEMVYRYWPVSEIYRTTGQTDTASGTVLTPLIPIDESAITKISLLKFSQYLKIIFGK